MEEWLKASVAGGFPVMVAVYLLVRMERVLTELRDAVRELVHQKVMYRPDRRKLQRRRR